MIDWIAGHTDRFKCLVSHDGVFDLVSEYGSTEELWFPEWEFRGPPWTNPELYRRLSPSSYVENFKTPTLVVQGELDFRVPVEQAWACSRRCSAAASSRACSTFPDEGHWCSKRGNSQLWYRHGARLDRRARPATKQAGHPAVGVRVFSQTGDCMKRLLFPILLAAACTSGPQSKPVSEPAPGTAQAPPSPSNPAGAATAAGRFSRSSCRRPAATPPAPPAGTSAAAQAKPEPPASDESAMDKSVDPCADFYQYACGSG